MKKQMMKELTESEKNIAKQIMNVYELISDLYVNIYNYKGDLEKDMKKSNKYVYIAQDNMDYCKAELPMLFFEEDHQRYREGKRKIKYN